ncbi:TPA: hypothetical protein SMT55_001808 [Proteus mirabilis]|nr:hypothetical protein [Proteus mirabilis]HEK2724191.1 hypothetical protein [Proteus mirabilis]
MNKEKNSPRLVTSIGMFIAFLILFYTVIVGIPALTITHLKLWDVNKIKEYSNCIFFLGVVVFFSSKIIDLRLTAKKNNSLCRLFFQALLDVLTPALFIFSMFGMDKYYYFAIEIISCILLALLYSMKALSLDKQVTERKISQFFYLNSKMKIVSQDIETVKTEVQKAISTQTKRLTVIIFVALGAGITIAKLLF